MQLSAFLSHVLHNPLLASLSLSQFLSFINLASNLKRSIVIHQPAEEPLHNAPCVLPCPIALFLASSTKIPFDSIPYLWLLLKDIIWDTLPDHEHQLQTLETFKTFGWKAGITYFSLYPPSNDCQNPDCPSLSTPTELRKMEARQVVVHTLDHGTQPAWAVHLYCKSCNSNYHNNFYVRDGVRTYYHGIPQYLQVSEHHFVEHRLAELWMNQHLLGACSATNCSRIYMATLAQRATTDFEAANWPFVPTLIPVHVWDAFVLLALLHDHHNRSLLLSVPHTGDQSHRFHDAMHERNERIVHLGQPDVTHYCDGCMRVYAEANDGTLVMFTQDSTQPSVLRKCQVVVSDGITLGHPCCGKFRCTEPLLNNRHRFCQTHTDLHSQCAISGCKQAVIDGTKTCGDPIHHKMEILSAARGKSAFSLKERLQRQRVANPNDAVVSLPNAFDTGPLDDLEENEEWFSVDGEVVHHHFEHNPGCVGVTDDAAAARESLICGTKSDEGNRRLKAQFGRRRTHNEQMLVRPCGVIVACATFFCAEAVSNEFVKKAFSVPGAQKPEHFIYDTTCDAKQQVQAHGDLWWEDVGMCVDVWHLLNKHKTTHDFCQKNCNPADYPELMNEEGNGWWFNTSVAEQVNVWLGSYHAICREMLPVKYNFFLDEMIRLKNVLTVESLRVKGWNPRHAPPT